MKNPNWQKCVINADSRDILKRIPDNSIDLILTDPPYNLAKHSTGNIRLPGRSPLNNDVAEWDMIEFNPEQWVDDFIRILKPTGNLFVFTSYNQLGRWYDCLDHKFDTTNFMIWHKTNPAPKIFKAGFLNSCEMIFTCWNKKHTWNFISQSEMHNFIESPICMRPERLKEPKHPTQKPVSILKKMLRIASNPGDIVFDPFMGVGSTGVAAIEMDRRFIGVEIDPMYFDAAKLRIQETMKKYPLEKSDQDGIINSEASLVCEPKTCYHSTSDELNSFFNEIRSEIPCNRSYNKQLSPIIKWPGGKEKELKYILPLIPSFDRYLEPFVGGGSVFMAIDATEYIINDLSSELISLYKYIASSDADFFRYCELIDKSWEKSYIFSQSNKYLIYIYVKYRNGQINTDELKSLIHCFCKERTAEIMHIIDPLFSQYPNILMKEMETNLARKMMRMRALEIEKSILPDKDVVDNIETAIKSAVYMNYRYMYNDSRITQEEKQLHTALFFFIRNYAYSGMFRYSSTGDFNVPYGGMAYNTKTLIKKLNYYRTPPVLSHFLRTKIYNLDFEEFFSKTEPTKHDFIFLDPPYDSEFSTYAKNAFTRSDQQRLADFLIYRCKAKWMLIIKNTDFIYNLYNKENIHIRSFEKDYLVSFMNRNNKKATHLVITNYN